MELNKAYDEIFSSKNLHENLSKINGEFKGNELVDEVINFIAKDKKRAICTPLNKEQNDRINIWRNRFPKRNPEKN